MSKVKVEQWKATILRSLSRYEVVEKGAFSKSLVALETKWYVVEDGQWNYCSTY